MKWLQQVAEEGQVRGAAGVRAQDEREGAGRVRRERATVHVEAETNAATQVERLVQVWNEESAMRGT